MMDEEKKYIEDLKKHVDYLRPVKIYSIQRIDLLVISLGSGGVFICVELMKYISQHEILKKYETVIGTPYKYLGFVFTLTILLNLLSQWTAYLGSSIALESTKADIYKRENPSAPNNEDLIKKMDSKAAQLSKMTRLLNSFSVWLLLVGLLLLATFFIHLF